MMDSNNEKFMKVALQEAKLAYTKKEVPVGAIITLNGKIIARAHNLRHTKKNALFHAEILVIQKACKLLKSWHLENTNLYVTLEPCPMCAGAIINSRISKIIYGAHDEKNGACGSVINVFEYKFNHIPQVISGILDKESGEILKKFFFNLRKNKI